MDECVIETDGTNTPSPQRLQATTERNRAALYRWFSRFFYTTPGEAEVSDLCSGRMRVVLESLAVIPGAEEPVATICRTLDRGSAASVATSLGVAQTRLFEGVGGHPATPPYRSVFTSDSGLLCQKASLEMEQVLRQYHLKLDESVCEPADHLSLQLELLSQLALLAATEMETGAGAAASFLDGQVNFINQQLLDWLPPFARRLATVDELGFHASLAALLILVLEQDRAYLTELLDSGDI